MIKTYTVDLTYDGIRIDKWIRNNLGNVPQSLIEKSLRAGKIKLNKKKIKSSIKLRVKDIINVYDIEFKEKILQKKIKFKPTEEIIKENENLIIDNNENFIVLNKESGIAVQGGTKSKKNLIDIFSKSKIFENSKPYSVHRLDKDTSGVLLVARTEKFRNYFIQQMQERNVKKEYTAVVVGSTLGSFSIEDPIGRDKFNRTKMSIRADGKEARTFIKLNERINNYSVLDVSIETGRTHQIRVHLSSKKLPIVGDKTYDPAKSVAKESSTELVEIIRSFPRQALHAKLLSFECPETKKQISYEAAIPKDINNLILDIKKHS